MDQQPLHWSERAKIGLPPLAPSSLAPPQNKLPGAKRRGLSKKSALRIVIGLVVAFAVIYACLGVFHLYNRLAGNTPKVATVTTMVPIAVTAQPVVATAAPSTTTTTQGVQMTAYKDKTFGFSFSYPKSWTEMPYLSATGNNAQSITQVVFGDPAGHLYSGVGHDFVLVLAVKLPTTVGKASMHEMTTFLEQQLAAAKTQIPDFKIEEAPSDCTVNGIPGSKTTFSAPVQGHTVIAEIYVLGSGRTAYQIEMQADNEDWHRDKPLFDSTVASFKLGGAS